jgi:cytoskeleton protein RodZ
MKEVKAAGVRRPLWHPAISRAVAPDSPTHGQDRDNRFEMAPELGQSLREARIRGGIELSQVEQATKIRVKYLRAMEDDQWELLPGPAYARGFLRTYARFLGLDDEVLVQEYGRRHERVEEVEDPLVEPVLPGGGGVGRPRGRPSGTVLAGLILAAVLGGLFVVGLIGGSGNGDHGAGRGAGTKKASPSATTTSATAPAPQPAQVSLRLRSTGTVWVCLVDDRGRALVNGVTLTAGEARGPFQARAFKVTFGNGEVRMEVDNKPFGVPQVAEPLGYEIASRGVSELASSSRPTCV